MEQTEREFNAGALKRPRLAIKRPWLYGKVPKHLRGTVLVDRRTKIGRAVCDFRVELTQHVGGHPSVTQKHLIEVCAQLQARLLTMDFGFAEDGEITIMDSRVYLAWANTLVRSLRALGLKGPAATSPSLADIVAELKAKQSPDLEEDESLADLADTP